jgi:DNA-directed RNA polymerase specialized sigma24 family protein
MWIHSNGGRCRNCNKLCQFEGSIVDTHKARVDWPALEGIGKFTTCAAKFHWIALVLTGDEKAAARAVSSGIDGVDGSRTVFGDWLCAWSVRNVIEACAALRADELKKEEGSGEYWRAKAAEGSTGIVQLAPLSKEQLRRALLLLPSFPRFAYVLRVLEDYSLPYVASTLKVDKDACQAALTFSFGALAQALMPVQPAKQQ